MKKILYLLTFATLLQACKKDSRTQTNTEADTQKQAVSFNVSGFSQTMVPLDGKKVTAANDPLGIFPIETEITRLTYVVYNEQGKQVSRLEQTTGEANKLFRVAGGKRFLINSASPFGSFTDSLKTGTYTVVTFAGGDRSRLNAPQTWNTPDSYPELSLSEAKFYPTLENYYYAEDAFTGKTTIEVGAVSNATKSLNLYRIVGQLTLNMEDGMPAGTYYVKAFIKNTGTAFMAATGTITGNVNHTNTTILYGAAPVGVPDTKITWYVLNGSSVDLTIEFAGGDTRTILTKTITNIPVKQNQRTIVTGKIINKSSTSFSVNVNQQWSGLSTIAF